MPPRKSDAASRKSNAGADAAPPDDTVAGGDTTEADMADADAVEADAAAKDKDKDKEKDKDKDKDKEPRKSHHSDAVAIEDLNMPRSIVTRLAKGVLPANTQLQGSAMTAMTKSATVFISHLASAANTLTTNAGKKTIMPADVFAALDDVEFGFMREQLEAEFAKFNQIQTSKRTDYRKRVAAAKKGPGEGEAEGGEGGAEDDKAEDSAPAARDAPPQAKKARLEGGKVGEEGGHEEDHEEEEEEHGEEEDHEEEEEEEDEDEEEDEEEEDDDEEDDNEDDAEDRDGPEDEALDSDGSE